jgi:hypothetical protein
MARHNSRQPIPAEKEIPFSWTKFGRSTDWVLKGQHSSLATRHIRGIKSMKLLRNLMLALMATMTLLTPLASEPAARAQTPHHHHAHHHVFRVYYRICPASAWVCYGGYHQQGEALRAAHYFRARGYEAFCR